MKTIAWFLTRFSFFVSLIVFIGVTVDRSSPLPELSNDVHSFALTSTIILLLITISLQLVVTQEQQRGSSTDVHLALTDINNRLDAHFDALDLHQAENVAFVRVLNTPLEFYRALNSARAESTKHISVMKLHQQGPQTDVPRAFDETRTLDEKDLSVEEREMRKWYLGTKNWLKVSGRTFERIQPVSNESMEEFQRLQVQALPNHFISHRLPWDGELPLVNICIFDDDQLIICFSTRSWETKYRPVPGFRIKHPEITKMFRDRYYLRMVEYCEISNDPSL